MELRTLLNGFLLSCKVEGKSLETVRFYKGNLDKFLWYAEEYGLPSDAREITVEHVRQFLAYLRDNTHRYNSSHIPANRPLSPTTIKRFYASLRVMFNWAITEGFLDANPVACIKPPKEARHVVKALTAEQIQKVLAAADGRDFEAVRNQAIVLVLVDTGVRLGELISLTVESVDLDRQLLRVCGKTGERYARFGARTAKALWKYLALRSRLDGATGALWASRHGYELKANAVDEMLRDLGKKAGMKLHAHLLRHSFATLFLQNGGNPFQVQYLLGHSSLDMTKRYCQALGFQEAYQAHTKASPIDCLKLRSRS